MRTPLALCCTFAVLCPALNAQKHTPRPHPTSATVTTPASSLPITHVALYKNGVGFFEHTGRVSGDEAVTIDFTSAQLNDVLQSLTAIDLGGGRISGAGYNSTTPLAQQLKTLPLALSDDPSDVDFYNAIRGARVQVTAPGGSSITGRLLSIDLRQRGAKDADSDTSSTPAKEETVSRRFLTVVADSGAVRTLELTPAVTVTLLDSALHTDVTRYLELLAANRSEGLRHLTLTDRGAGARELRVSYISEVPVWKSTYRILFTGDATAATMQGWSVVDNTTGSDWVNVHLDLIAGAPQSFIQPLSTPLYARRPEIALPEESQLSPQTHDSGETFGGKGPGIHGQALDASGAIIPNAEVTVTNLDDNSTSSATTDDQGRFQVAGDGNGRYRVTVSSPGFQTLTQNGVVLADGQSSDLKLRLNVGSVSEAVTVSSAQIAAMPMNGRSANRLMKIAPGVVGGTFYGYNGSMGGPIPAAAPPIDYQLAASQSLNPNTTTSAFDDYFAYTLTDPISIRKNESALVPILQTRLPVERVSLWSVQQPVALRALWLTNSSNLTLDRGSFSIVENGSFGGEGLLDPIHPGEKRLLSYAADQAVRVTPERGNYIERITHITIKKGVLTETSSDVSEVNYAVRNAAPETRTVLIEQPIKQGWDLTSDPKPAETTPTTYRFRVVTKPQTTEHLKIAERHTNQQNIRLVDRNEDQLILLLRNAKVSPQLMAELQPVFELHHQVIALDAQINERQAQIGEITNDQNRLRQNLSALKGTPEEKALATRYTGELNAQEDRLAALHKEIDSLKAQRAAKDAEFNARLESVSFDEAL